MDPWQYTYNRLAAGVQGSSVTGDIHHHFSTQAAAAASAGANNTTNAHNLTNASTNTPQLLLQAAHGNTSVPFNPSSFLVSPNGNYENVFSPLFSHSGPKPAHFNALNAQRLAQAALNKQVADSDNNFSPHHLQLLAAGTSSGSPYFDQSAVSAAALAWQTNNQLTSPFGILPHEKHVASSPGSTTIQSPNNVKDAVGNHRNTPVAPVKEQPNMVTSNKSSITTNHPGSYYSNAMGYAPPNENNFAALNKPSQPSLNMTRSTAVSGSPNGYDHSATSVVIKSEPCQMSPMLDKSAHAHHVQTDSQTKIKTSMDSNGRLNYAENHTLAKAHQQYPSNQQLHQRIGAASASSTYNHNYIRADNVFQNSTNSKTISVATDLQQYPSNLTQQQTQGSECGSIAVAPKRPSPLQMQTPATPVYPMYNNSPMSLIATPQGPQQQQQQQHDHQQQQAANQINNYKLTSPKSPLSGKSQSQPNVAYSSVIQRVTQSPVQPNKHDHQPSWDNASSSHRNTLEDHARKFHTTLYNGMQQGSPHNHLNNSHDASVNNTTTMHNAMQYGNIEPASNQLVSSIAKSSADEPPKSTVPKVTGAQKRKAKEKPNAKDIPNSTISVPLPNRGLVPAHNTLNAESTHVNAINLLGSNTIDFDRWNQPAQSPGQVSRSTVAQQSFPLNSFEQSHLSYNQHQQQNPNPALSTYFRPPFQMSAANADCLDMSTVPPVPSAKPFAHNRANNSSFNVSQFSSTNRNHHQPDTQSNLNSAPISGTDNHEKQPQVIVPNIEDELDFLAENHRVNPSSQQHIYPNGAINNVNNPNIPANYLTGKPSTPTTKPIDPMNITVTGPTAGFMSSYLKFLQGGCVSSQQANAGRGSRKSVNQLQVRTYILSGCFATTRKMHINHSAMFRCL